MQRAFMEGRRLLESRSEWAKRKRSVDLRKEFGLDFKKAFKTAIQHFEVSKWMVETRRKPQVAFGQKESGGRCEKVSLGRQRSTEAGGRARSAQELAIFIAVGDLREAEGDTGGRLWPAKMVLKDSCAQKLGDVRVLPR